MDPIIISKRLSKYFTPRVMIDDKFATGFVGLGKKYKVLINQYTESEGYWAGTKIIFSGENASYFYKLVKSGKFDWKVLKFDEHKLSLGRIDLCFSRENDSNFTSKSFDAFLVDSRNKIQTHTTSRHIKLQDFPNGKMLKVNRRNNSRHYRVYQKDQTIRFELELKNRQTKLVENYLFENQLNVFEHQLVIKYFQYSKQILRSDYCYTDWILDFQRRYQRNATFRPLMTSYFKNEIITNKEKEERLFHLLQFLSFVKSLKVNSLKDFKKHKIKTQIRIPVKFPLNEFVNFTGIRISNHYERDKLISYFSQLQKLDPIVKIFSNKAFRSYVCFPYVSCENASGNSWVIEVLAAEELFCFPYPFQLPKSFLYTRSKNDLRLKIRLIKWLAVSEQKKILHLEEFFNTINVGNNPLIQIKKNLIELLSELVSNKMIHNEVGIVLKSGKRKDLLIRNLTTSDITRRIKFLELHEMFQKIL